MEVCCKMKKTVLITGVSGGIGKELADRFAKGGYNLVLVARSEGKLLELAKEYRKDMAVKRRSSQRMWLHPVCRKRFLRSSRRRGSSSTILSIMPASVCTGRSWRRS
ncbi:SDR family NAD(P)-dependent oxidoreductase [Bacillus pumilus]